MLVLWADDGLFWLLHAVQIFCPIHVPVGSSFPQCSVPHAVLYDAAISVGEACHRCGIIGYVSASFLVLKDHGSFEIWGRDLFIGLSPSAGSYKLFDFLAAGKYNQQTGGYSVCGNREPELPPPREDNDRKTNTNKTESKRISSVCASNNSTDLESMELLHKSKTEGPEQRFYVSIHTLMHPLLQKLHYTPFFHSCRVHGMCFDAEVRMRAVVYQLLTNPHNQNVWCVLFILRQHNHLYAEDFTPWLGNNPRSEKQLAAAWIFTIAVFSYRSKLELHLTLLMMLNVDLLEFCVLECPLLKHLMNCAMCLTSSLMKSFIRPTSTPKKEGGTRWISPLIQPPLRE